jgi:REP element-mobilizing transposase RayT
MVYASHVIFTTYGFWLPNDPRGSWSDFVGAWELFRFGPATKVDTTRSVAAAPHNRELRLAAKQALKYPEVHFTGVQAKTVARGFRDSIERGKVRVWACCILPEHVHMVIARHTADVEWIGNLLKGAATRELREHKMHPFEPFASANGKVPMCWARKLWKVFLDSDEAIRRAIKYVEDNPVKEGKRRQRWSFVKPYPV